MYDRQSQTYGYLYCYIYASSSVTNLSILLVNFLLPRFPRLCHLSVILLLLIVIQNKNIFGAMGDG